jgi:urea carboxylase-associated protein 2
LPSDPRIETLTWDFDDVSKLATLERCVTETSSLEGARAHARSLVDAATVTRTIPSTEATDLPAGVGPAEVIWDERIDLGNYASHVLARGVVARITDLDGDACVQLVVYNAAAPAERLNVIDTVKVQWQAYLDAGALLLSDMGRVLMSFVADTSARHDCLCGSSTRRTNAARYGDGLVSGPTPSGRDLLCLAGAKHGLERRDIAPNVNLFKGVRVTDDGTLHFDGAPTAPAYVELRAELDVIVLLANTPHPLDDRDTYSGTPVRVTAWRAAPATNDDPFRAATPERLRAFQNTDELVRASAP